MGTSKNPIVSLLLHAYWYNALYKYRGGERNDTWQAGSGRFLWCGHEVAGNNRSRRSAGEAGSAHRLGALVL